MALRFEELTSLTRQYMCAAFEEEEKAGDPYRSSVLSRAGREAFPEIMRRSLELHDDVWLGNELNRAEYWNEHDARGAAVPVAASSERLAACEFNTWYVRGVCRLLLDEGETQCQVYRAAGAKLTRGSCTTHEEQICSLSEILAGHRIRYWPHGGDVRALSIPASPNCHHSVRRLS